MMRMFQSNKFVFFVFCLTNNIEEGGNIMKVHLEKLPIEIYECLKKIQENPEKYAGFYIKNSSVGLSIFGLIVFAGAMIAGFFISQEMNDLPYLAWFGGAFIAAWIAIVSYHYLKDHKAAIIKPYIFINPLYVTKVGMEDVTYYSLWKDKKDLKITHQYTNGAYTGTSFNFYFQDGQSLSFTVTPKAKADSLINLLEAYRLDFIDAIEKQNFDSFMGHDIFYEMSDPKNQEKLDETLYPSPKSRSKWTTFYQIGMAASVLAAIFYYFSSFSFQMKHLRYCSSIESYEQFLEEHSPNFLKSQAQERLYQEYLKAFRQNKENVSGLKKLAQRHKFSLLSPDKKQEISRLCQEDTKQQIDLLYKKCMDNYKADSNVPAKDAILQMLEFANQNQKCAISIQYSWETGDLKGPFPIVTALGEHKNAQAPDENLVNSKNSAKESVLNEKIQEIMKQAIPYGIAEIQPSGDILMKISAVVHPSSYSYEFTQSMGITKDYFQGIEHHWSCQVFLKEKKIFDFTHVSIPPANLRVTYTRYGYAPGIITAENVYGKMIESAFDDFGTKLSEQWK